MGKLISSIPSIDTISLSEQTDGFWLWDKTRQMNLSMRAKTGMDALAEALRYYQGRLARVEQEHASLLAKVDAFVDQVKEPEELA